MSNPDLSLDQLHAASRRGRVPTLVNELPRLLGILVLLVGLVLLFIGDSFSLNVLATAFLFAGLATAWNIIGGLGGQFSLGHSVFFAIGAYMTANLILGYKLSPWLALLPSMTLGAVVAALVSWPVFRLRGPFFAIATMALTEVALALAMYFESVTGGAQGLSVPFKAGLTNMIFRDRMSYAFLMLGFLAVALLIFAAIRHSRLGYALQAVRDNEETAEAAGIDVLRTKLVGMAISAALMAAGGCLYLMYVRVVDPPSLFSLFDVGVKVALIALIGGIGTTYGPLLGALLIVPLENYLRAELGGAIPGSNLLALGFILMLTALYLRRGIVGAILKLRDRSWRILR
ncbi:branched-chain amino acid transport system permease protein [Mesorhizobium sp. J18]|uniref:branched-chain amino acid ABC transporter permease n=1 Tax=Mesorhizobium sp. J18 TaxID=935263 RepID=UPI00119C27E3|nr:branched-chain amino acid ABC transporter permease [Mesorhizobium sp. J18]TWG92059.1 branched-chain amino acid transport system permease protein [Mesorhizobium sp. J18]